MWIRLESQQVLRHEIEAIAAVEDEPCPQRVAALCPEARKIEQSHDVAHLQRRTVKSPSVRRPGCPRRPRCPCRSSLIAHRCSWCTAPQIVLASQWWRQLLPMPGNAQERTGVVLKADRCCFSQTACRFWGTFPRKALGVLFFRNRFYFGTDA